MNVIEKIIIRELNDIKDILLYPSMTSKNVMTKSSNHSSLKNIDLKKKVEMNQNDINSNTLTNNNNEIDDFDVDYEYDIIKNNMTILKDDLGIIFQYFWKIDNILEILDSRLITDSGDFYFSGKFMILNFFPYTNIKLYIFKI